MSTAADTLGANPKHLQPVTPLQNTMRSPIAPASVSARKTHCIRGHALSGENLVTHAGKRACRECRRQAEQKRRALKRTGTAL